MIAHQLDAAGVIINTIVVPSLGFLPNLVDASIGGGIGDSIINGILILKPMPAVVPDSVPMLNAHLALIAAGKMDAVTAAIEGMDVVDQQAANAYLNLAQTCRRDNALVAQLGPLIGLDSAGLDQLFIAAAALNP